MQSLYAAALRLHPSVGNTDLTLSRYMQRTDLDRRLWHQLPIHCLVFTARRYARAVFVIVVCVCLSVCLSVRPSVRHKSVLGRPIVSKRVMNQVGFLAWERPSTYYRVVMKFGCV